MKTTIVTTVLNEEGSIVRLLQSLVEQTKKPDEIIVVDGNSTDTTVPLVKQFIDNNPGHDIKVLVKRGNISHGRNYGISKSKNEVVALIDAGCVAHKDWLEKITAPFSDQKVGVVAGFYKMTGDNLIQRVTAPFHGTPLSILEHKSYLPSARSMAIRKQAWEVVGGFSETLQRAGEDTLFNYEIVRHGIIMKRAPDALVDWDTPSTIAQTMKKFYEYAAGDAESGIWWHPAKRFATHNIKVLTIFARYFVLFVLLLLSLFSSIFFVFFIFAFVSYTSWSIWKMRMVLDGLPEKLFVPVVQIMSDFYVMAGFLAGLRRRRRA
jgi:glycosyltransferase involved in cell wall biosynthesis